MGRPTKQKQPRNVRLSLKFTEEEAELLNKCSKEFNKTKTDVIVLAIQKLYETEMSI